MFKYTDRYKELLSQIETYKNECLDDVVLLFKTIELKPIAIGNMVYYICKDEEGIDVPAYCYLGDYTENEEDFKPIYDRHQTHEYGWSNFEEVANILEVIRKTIIKKENSYGKI